ncbi:MAG: alpha-ketoacid dehydrogenase subunit beta, partial [Actinobacteria bacterium]|nr:alpha-ketoacid dehydrogenase subunit beta [Actinomycetota bacterium]NIS37074.1 alpha-ketoacid dehydrogenase subunit beta [Actinomycetota bacterium]NIU21398.1 alpha-ketoacid dehydrogenase subunit beta [Actinomycetota bacterium]NIU71543.1 alpha-ketoacid dehydrogenase subunit beta [Actinomycetota bacterium]NIV90903.1 alpha-ketoacid dehydrogenase subunit beta [Actinomycetota bacterium]
MAVAGLRPIAEIQFMGFSYPAFDQVINHVSRIRNRSRHRFTAPMVIRIPYGA